MAGTCSGTPDNRWSVIVAHNASLNHCGLVMLYDDIDLGQHTKPSPEPVLTSHKWGSVAVALTWTQFNSLCLNDAIQWHRFGTTLAQVMTCCLPATSRYLNQCWHISRVLWHLSGCIIWRRLVDTNQLNKIEICILKITSKSPRDQWVNREYSSYYSA